jgi:hypothetical protein
VTDPLTWLAGRAPAPPSLRTAIEDALRRGDPGAGPLPDRLAAAGVRTLRRVVESPGDRGVATELLAADALLTYACEAAAEEGPEAVRELARAFGPARFAEILPEEGTE